MDHEPSVIENELLDQLTDRLMLSDAHRASRASQTKISDMSENRETALVARGETRRLMGLLGLLPNGKSSGFGGDEQPKRLADVLKPKAVA
jgi:hypothetical protein